MRVLAQFAEFLAFRSRRRDVGEQAVSTEAPDRDPVETMEDAYQEAEATLAQELLTRIVSSSPSFFENLVLDLLEAMGYGGLEPAMRRHLGRSGDEGVDGVIGQDRLGLDQVYVQAKRWRDNPVGRRDIQAFVGALEGQRASRGVFITTSTFNTNAVEYARSLSRRVVLIDGAKLSELLIRHGVGVRSKRSFHVKEIDDDYFSDES